MTATAIHFQSTNKTALEDFVAEFAHVLPLTQGRSAEPEYVDEEGYTVPERPAVGVVGMWYTTVMLEPSFEFDIVSGITYADAETVGQLCGKFA